METRSLTYTELADALGITAASAKRLAIRRKWPKAPGNDGRTRVAVPLERLESQKRVADDITDGDTSDDADDVTRDTIGDASGDITQVVSVLARHIENLEKELAQVRERASDRDLLEGQLAGLRTVIEAERKRAEELRVERDRLLDRLMMPPGLFDRLRRAFR